MAKKATPASGRTPKPKAKLRKPVRTAAKSKAGGQQNDFNAADAFFKLLESPLVADLLAVGATAALAAITESRHSRRTGAGAKSSKMMKEAGKAAAAAIGRRLTTEFEEIRKASKKTKASEAA